MIFVWRSSIQETFDRTLPVTYQDCKYHLQMEHIKIKILFIIAVKSGVWGSTLTVNLTVKRRVFTHFLRNVIKILLSWQILGNIDAAHDSQQQSPSSLTLLESSFKSDKTRRAKPWRICWPV